MLATSCSVAASLLAGGNDSLAGVTSLSDSLAGGEPSLAPANDALPVSGNDASSPPASPLDEAASLLLASHDSWPPPSPSTRHFLLELGRLPSSQFEEIVSSQLTNNGEYEKIIINII